MSKGDAAPIETRGDASEEEGGKERSWNSQSRGSVHHQVSREALSRHPAADTACRYKRNLDLHANVSGVTLVQFNLRPSGILLVDVNEDLNERMYVTLTLEKMLNE